MPHARQQSGPARPPVHKRFMPRLTATPAAIRRRCARAPWVALQPAENPPGSRHAAPHRGSTPG
eukprot:3310673-Prymnesium_polylepis.2